MRPQHMIHCWGAYKRICRPPYSSTSSKLRVSVFPRQIERTEPGVCRRSSSLWGLEFPAHLRRRWLYTSAETVGMHPKDHSRLLGALLLAWFPDCQSLPGLRLWDDSAISSFPLPLVYGPILPRAHGARVYFLLISKY